MPINENTTDEWWAAFAYSEWLDQRGLMVTEGNDQRSHEVLVDEFMAGRDPEEG